MKKILLLLLITTASYSQTLLKLKAIEYAPGAGYIPYTNASGVQTYSLLSTVVSTVGLLPTTTSITINGVTKSFTSTPSFTIAAGTGSVETVSGNGVDNTDPYNPIVTPLLSDIAANSGGTLEAQPISDLISSLTQTVLAGSSTFMYRQNGTGDMKKISFTDMFAYYAPVSVVNTTLTAGANMSITASGQSYTLASTTSTTGLASLTGVETLTNKRITLRTNTLTTTATITVNSDSYDMTAVTTLSTATTFTAPTGTPTEGQGLIYRIKDNGTARALTFNSAFRFSSDLPAPTTTILSKVMYLLFVYNLTDAKWDCINVTTNY